ncbi:MAG: hypothetical protein AMJ78_04405 [Omnitrophica WOR_2 bacterium SM23_29]|nr:MAG: hypothetical protein AMJ78_04405 [Omnitrophica WOR_2 bacterium SM23_29]
MKTSIVMPIFNEEKTIADVLNNLLKLKKDDWEILVIDDGSTDRTFDILNSFSGIRVIKHPKNRGYGAALKSGIEAASYDYVLMIDADGTYPVEEIPLLMKYAEDADMVVGARTGEDVNIPWLRRPAKAILNSLANYLSETKIPDLNSGFRIFKKEIISKFFHILPNGFSFTTTITLTLLVNNYNVIYVPVNYHKRKGKSKFHPIKDTMNFFLLIIRTIMYFNPLKIFLPLSGLLFFIGIGILFYSHFIMGRIMDVTTVLCIVSAIQIAVIGLLADLIDKRLQR